MGPNDDRHARRGWPRRRMLWWLLACERPLIGFTGIPPALCFPVWDSVLGMRMPFSWSLGCRCCEDMTFNMVSQAARCSV
ncbi:unnamed protein product [Musa textilis]